VGTQAAAQFARLYPSSLCDHFLIVALDEGKSVSTYARAIGVMATSRNDKSCHSDYRFSEILTISGLQHSKMFFIVRDRA
jgi:hypothetical protein